MPPNALSYFLSGHRNSNTLTTWAPTYTPGSNQFEFEHFDHVGTLGSVQRDGVVQARRLFRRQPQCVVSLDLTPSPDSGTVGCQERTGGCCLESLGLGSTPCHAARCGQRQSLARYLLSGEQSQMP